MKHDGRIGFKGKEITNALKAIRAFCKECVETSKDIEECTGWTCPLFPFRFGFNPYHSKVLNHEKDASESDFSDVETL